MSLSSLLGAWALGQLSNKVAPAVGQVNPQVNTELYGGGVSASVRYANMYSSSRPMDSELRYAYAASGALPSDIRMGYAALGPLTPSGPMAYIPPSTPSYMPQPSTAPPAALGSAAYSNASVRYSGAGPGSASSSSYVAPRSVSSASISPGLVSQGPINSGPINSGPINGAVRYSR